MPLIPPLLPHDAPQEVTDVYEDFSRRMRFPSPPNFILTQGHSPSVVRGSWDLVRNVLVTGKIDRWIKEMIFVAISKDRNCHYCTAAHIACCRMLGVDPSILESLVRDVKSIVNLKLRDIILFGLKCSRDPQKLVDADYETLRQHELGQPEIMEIIAMSALAVYANVIADATKMEPDAMFGKFPAAAPSN
jgi:uncharacterized peroxidase-related enzyme